MAAATSSDKDYINDERIQEFLSKEFPVYHKTDTGYVEIKDIDYVHKNMKRGDIVTSVGWRGANQYVYEGRKLQNDLISWGSTIGQTAIAQGVHLDNLYRADGIPRETEDGGTATDEDTKGKRKTKRSSKKRKTRKVKTRKSKKRRTGKNKKRKSKTRRN